MKKIIAVLLLASPWLFCRSQTAALPADTNPLTMEFYQLGAVPFEGLAATVKDISKVSLRWQTAAQLSESFYVIERSINGSDFVTIGVIKNSEPGAYEYVDDAPPRGKMYYRVKITSGQNSLYSTAVSVMISGDVSCKFYPNPVDKALIIRSEWPLDLVIADKFGKPVISSRLPAGLKIVDVSTLEPGIYVITLFQKEPNRLITEKLVKK
jgi:hypothetical protein